MCRCKFDYLIIKKPKTWAAEERDVQTCTFDYLIINLNWDNIFLLFYSISSGKGTRSQKKKHMSSCKFRMTSWGRWRMLVRLCWWVHTHTHTHTHTSPPLTPSFSLIGMLKHHSHCFAVTRETRERFAPALGHLPSLANLLTCLDLLTY